MFVLKLLGSHSNPCSMLRHQDEVRADPEASDVAGGGEPETAPQVGEEACAEHGLHPVDRDVLPHDPGARQVELLRLPHPAQPAEDLDGVRLRERTDLDGGEGFRSLIEART